MRIFQCVVLVLAVFASTGCGSFLGRMSHREKPYPGLRFATEELTSQEKPGVEQVLWLDMPLSLAVDTLLIPIDALEASSGEN
jgi:uncharacterized protein YceK